VPSAAAAMAAAAAAAQKQAMLFNPAELKHFQNRLHVMTQGHNNINNYLGPGESRSREKSPNNMERVSSSSSSLSLSSGGSGLSTRSIIDAVIPLSPGRNKGTSTSFSNGYHHHSSSSEKFQNSNNIPINGGGNSRIQADQIIPSHFLEQRIRTASEPNSPASDNGSSSLSPIPSLLPQDNEILVKLSDSAIQIVKSLPPYVFEPQLPPKKKLYGDFEVQLDLKL